MPTWSQSYTFTGSEAIGFAFINAGIPNFGGDYALELRATTPANGIWNFNVLWHDTAINQTCVQLGVSLLAGQDNNGRLGTVGNPAGTGAGFWSCTTFTRIGVSLDSFSAHPPAATVITLSITAAGLPASGYCENGYEIQPGRPGVQILDEAIVQGALALIPGAWWQQLLYTFVGTALDIHVICSGAPPTVTSIASTLLINPGRAALEVLYASLWPYFCRCAAGTVTPTVPPLPNPTKPPDWPPDPTYPVNPTNPCLDISEVLRRLAIVQRITGNDLELDKAVQRYAVPFAHNDGAVHTDLTGTGSFVIDRTLGFRVELTSGGDNRQLKGNPPYIWDVGWMSITDGGAMLIERRIARTSLNWFPPQCQLADHFNWYLNPGEVITVTELEVEA